MTQPSDQKSPSAPKPQTELKQPTSAELSSKELDQAAGGIQIVKHVDKASPKLMLGN